MRNQYFFPAYLAIWKLIKNSGNKKLLLSFSFFIIKICHSDEISNNEWLKAYILYSKSLCIDNQLENSLEVLRSLMDLFPFYPIEDLKYIEEINKTNKISFKNNFLKHDLISNFFSRGHVYQKCEKIFNGNYNYEKPSSKDLELYDFPLLKYSLYYNANNTDCLVNNEQNIYQEKEKCNLIENPYLEYNTCKSKNNYLFEDEILNTKETKPNENKIIKNDQFLIENNKNMNLCANVNFTLENIPEKTEKDDLNTLYNTTYKMTETENKLISKYSIGSKFYRIIAFFN